MKTMELNSILIALIIIILWALSSFFMKISVGKLGVYPSIFWTYVAFVVFDAAVFILILYFKLASATFNFYSWFAILAALSSTTGFIIFYWLVHRMNVSIAVPLTNLSPAIVVLLAVLVLKEKIKLVNAVGILLALAAGVLLAL